MIQQLPLIPRQQFIGTSLDVKPTGTDANGLPIGVGATFHENDTALDWQYDGTTWWPFKDDPAIQVNLLTSIYGLLTVQPSIYQMAILTELREIWKLMALRMGISSATRPPLPEFEKEITGL